MKLRLRRKAGYTPRHQYQEPALRSSVPPVTPTDIPPVMMDNAMAVFVTVDGRVIPPGHPAYLWLRDMEEDFRRHLQAVTHRRTVRARQIWEHARIDAQMLATGGISGHEMRKIIVDRARMASGMRPRPRVSTRPIPRSTYVPQFV